MTDSDPIVSESEETAEDKLIRLARYIRYVSNSNSSQPEEVPDSKFMRVLGYLDSMDIE